MISLYSDENVEAAIVRGLRLRGIDVTTAEEDGYEQTADPLILDRAAGLRRVVFSRDQDFLREATRRQRTAEPFAGVIYAHKSRVSIGTCIEDLVLICDVCSVDDFENRIQYLPL